MELFFRKFGEGTPMIITHGLYGASDNWVTVGKALAEHFEVYLLDQRNHGRSPHSMEHSYGLMRDDLLEFMNAQEIEKAILVGHSMGGKTAMFFAAEYPERVQALVVVDIAPKSYFDVDSFEQETIDHQRIIRTMRAIDFTKVSSRADVETQMNEHLPWPRISQFLMKNLKREKDNTFSWSLNVEALHKNVKEILDGLNPDDFRHGNEVTGFPVLFIRGEKSDYILPDDINLIYNIFPYAEIVSIPNAGHWVHAEQPQLLIKNILYFISL